MKRHTSLKSNMFSPLSSLVGQDIIYMQMSHHYRRLLSAKSNVGSAHRPPCYCRPQPSPRHLKASPISQHSYQEPTPSDMRLVERIIYDDKHRPEEVYREHLAGKWHEDCHPRPAPPRHDCTGQLGRREACRQPSAQRPACKKARGPSDLLEQHRDCFRAADPHKPRILKTSTQSHVRDLKVYHPPRRKPKKGWETQPQPPAPEQREWPESEPESLYLQCQCQCRVALTQPSSKVSVASRDSAYNGGVSSGGESRGPTPEQTGPVSEWRGAQLGREPVTHVARGKRSPTPSPAGKPPQTRDGRKAARADQSPAKSPPQRPAPEKGHRKKQPTEPGTDQSPSPVTPSTSLSPREDLHYAAFSQRITQDILAREILSSRGINAVFQRHLDENRGLLDTELMLREVELLRAQLGVEEGNGTPLPGCDVVTLWPGRPSSGSSGQEDEIQNGSTQVGNRSAQDFRVLRAVRAVLCKTTQTSCERLRSTIATQTSGTGGVTPQGATRDVGTGGSSELAFPAVDAERNSNWQRGEERGSVERVSVCKDEDKVDLAVAGDQHSEESEEKAPAVAEELHSESECNEEQKNGREEVILLVTEDEHSESKCEEGSLAFSADQHSKNEFEEGVPEITDQHSEIECEESTSAVTGDQHSENKRDKRVSIFEEDQHSKSECEERVSALSGQQLSECECDEEQESEREDPALDRKRHSEEGASAEVVGSASDEGGVRSHESTSSKDSEYEREGERRVRRVGEKNSRTRGPAPQNSDSTSSDEDDVPPDFRQQVEKFATLAPTSSIGSLLGARRSRPSNHSLQ